MKQPCIFIDSETISDALTEQGNPDFFAGQIRGLIKAGYVVEAGTEPGNVENRIFTGPVGFQAWFNEVRDSIESSDDEEPEDNEDSTDDEAQFYDRESQKQANGENYVDESLSPKQMDEAERRAGVRDD